jgi:hypothetical protein
MTPHDTDPAQTITQALAQAIARHPAGRDLTTYQQRVDAAGPEPTLVWVGILGPMAIPHTHE